MSVQAISWALEEAPDVPARLVSTLIGLANHAGRDGRGSYPSTETISHYTRKSVRQVQRDIDDLEALGLIARGDQRMALHIRPDHRPVVWDLAVGRARGDTHVIPLSGDGVTPGAERGDMGDAHGVTPMSPEPYLRKPTTKTFSEADASDSGADAPGTDAGAPCGGRDDSSALFDLGSDLTEDGGDDLGAVAGSTPSRSKKPRPGRRGVSTPDEEQGRIIRSLVGAWVEAFQANHPGLKPTKSQRGQVGRGVKELVLAGNPTDKIQSAAEYAGSGGIATVVNEFARIHSASNGRDRRIRRQDLPPEDWRRFVQE